MRRRADPKGQAPAAGPAPLGLPPLWPLHAFSQADGAPDGSLPTVRLRILATTDLHAQLLAYDYFANRPLHGLGLAPAASLIAAARAEVPGALLLDNGDFLQGTALAEIAARPGRRRPHPAIAAFNALGYDAVALGNHEFNYGLPLLEDALRDARFPVLSANVARRLGPDPLSDDFLVAPDAMILRDLTDSAGRTHRLRIGLVGLTPPQIMDWDRRNLFGRLAVRPMVEAARARVPALRRRGADVVICLAHTGLSPTGQPGEDCAGGIAAIAGVDAVIAGHSHEVFPAPARPGETSSAQAPGGTPIVQPGHSGSHLGVIDLVLAPVPAGGPAGTGAGWRVARAGVAAISVSEVTAGLSTAVLNRNAAPLRVALTPDHRAALSWMRQTLGETSVPLSTSFAAVADVQAMRLVAAALVAHARARLAGRPEGALPVVASVTPYRNGGRGGPLNYTEIPPGPLTLRNVFDLYPFPNTVVAERVTGRMLLDRLERSAGIFHRVLPGASDQPLIDPAFPATAFEILSGLSYRIDLSRPPGQGRILGLSRNGQPVGPDDAFVLVTNSFLCAAAPGADIGPDGGIVLDEGSLCTDVLAAHIRQTGRILADPGPGWSLAPMPGTTVVHDSGPGALDALHEAATLHPVFLGITPEGFHRFRLHL